MKVGIHVFAKISNLLSGVASVHLANPGYYLYCGQLTPYKRPDLAVECFNNLGLPLRVIGDGEMLTTLKKCAKSNIQFLGRVGDDDLRYNMARCRALVFPGEEDFGIVPVEAMGCGRPVIAYGRGGALDTIMEGVTGVFFHEPTADALAAAVQHYQTTDGSFDPDLIARHAAVFDTRNFIEQMSEVVQDVFATRAHFR